MREVKKGVGDAMFSDVAAQCPYFLRSDKLNVHCEGITDGCITVLKFKTKEKRNQHRSIFCDAKYRNCEIYRMLGEKYEE